MSPSRERVLPTLVGIAIVAIAAIGSGTAPASVDSTQREAQSGFLNLCKVAGTGVSAGQVFDFRVTLSGVTRIASVPAEDCVSVEVPRESSALGKGYFKNHPEVVARLVPPAVKLVVGGAELTAAQVQAIQGPAANVSFASNLLLNLTQQLLATELNILRGVQPSAQVSQAITDANAGVKITIDGQRKIQLTTALTKSQMSALVTTLTAFNEGKLKGSARLSSADLQIVESIPADLEVSSIACDPSARCSNIDLDAGRVTATVVGGTTTTVTYTNRSTPTEPPPPPPSGDSSQELIDRDLQDGVIDYPTSLVYRTWALFRDLRLPARYAALPSAGEDQSLFDQLEADFDSLPPDAQAATRPYLVPPNDPESAFGPGPQPTGPSRVTHSRSAVQALPFEETRCNPPASWRPEDWTPAGGGLVDGFRIWVCTASDEKANSVFEIVKAAAAPLWAPMTRLGPDGMGKPVPDTVKGNTVNFGNGKIDIWIVNTSDCPVQTCSIGDGKGGFNLGAELTLSGTCGESGYPTHSCSGYIVLNAGLLCSADLPCPQLKGTLAHEFFHVLQDAHNADAWKREVFRIGDKVVWEKSWYSEASAMWAAWHYAKDPRAYPHFTQSFQTNDRSLLHFDDSHEYGSWVWPLLMQLEPGGASSVFESWYTAESATRPAGLDDAVDRTLPFADHFRDFSVRNLNPAEYFNQGGIGLEDDLWQTDLGDFPRTPHVLQNVGSIVLGDQSLVVEIAVLAAEDTKFGVAPNVRQVTIDVASLTNASNADIDVVGRLMPDDKGGPPTWSRIRDSGTSVTFCRDNPGENFDLVYVVLSNHGRARAPLGGADPKAALSGAYTISAKDHCDVPIRYEGTFKVIQTSSSPPSLLDLTAVGKVTFKYASTEAECGSLVPPTPITSLHHCYYLDSAQETWTAPSFSTDRCKYSPHDAHFSYANDEGRHGGIDITIRNSFFPEFSNTYDVSFGSSTKTMVVDVTDVNPEQECDDSRRPTFTIGLPFYSINSTCNSFTIPPERFTGWPLRRSRTCQFGQTEITTVIYSWDLQPIFDTES